MNRIIEENWEITGETVNQQGNVVCDIMSQSGQMVAEELDYILAKHIVMLHQNNLINKHKHTKSNNVHVKDIYWCNPNKRRKDGNGG